MRATPRVMVLVLAVAVASIGAGVLDRQPRIVDDVYHAITTVRDMYSLGVALEAYYIDNRAYPTVTTAKELKSLLQPRYAAHLAEADAWGEPIRYLPASDGQAYRLVSAGSDRQFNERSWGQGGVFLTSSEDAVFAGRFLRKWAIDIP